MVDNGTDAAVQRAIQGGEVTVYQLILEQLSTLRKEQRDGFDGIRGEFNGRFDKLVTSDAFVAERRRVDERFESMTRDLDAESKTRIQAVDSLSARSDKMVNNVKWLIGAILVPGVPMAYSIISSLVEGT